MKITNIRIKKQDHPKLKAFVTVTVDGWIVFRGIKIILGNEGLFVAMPRRLKPDGPLQDHVPPIDVASRAIMEHAVYMAYRDSFSPPEQVGFPIMLPGGPPPMQRGAARERPPRGGDGSDPGFGRPPSPKAP